MVEYIQWGVVLLLFVVVIFMFDKPDDGIKQ